MSQRLASDGVGDDALTAMEAAVAAEVEAAVAFAEAGTDEPVESLLTFVTSPGVTS